MLGRQRIWILVFVIVFGALLRVWGIDDQSLWVDEGYAVYHSNHPSLVTSLSQDTHPPLYFAGFRLWQEVAGNTEFSLRYFSLLPSLLSIALIYHLAREFVYLRGESPKHSLAPLFAVVLLALADSEIFLSQEARHYTWHVFLAIASMWVFLRWLRTENRRWWWVWIVFTTLLAYTHYIGTFTGVTQGVYALLFLRGNKRWQALLGLIISALLLVPWLVMVGRFQIDNNGAGWSVDLSWEVLADIRNRYFTQHWALWIGLIVLGMFSLLPNPSFRWRRQILPVLWILVPFILIIIVNLYLPFLQPRRLSQIAPAIVIAVAIGLAAIPSPTRIFLLAVMVISNLGTIDFYRVKPPWRDVGQQTALYATAEDLILTDISGGDYQIQYYHGRYLPPYIPRQSLKVWRDFEPETYEAGLPTLLEQHDSIWMMHWTGDRSAFAWLDTLGFKNTAQLRTPHDTGNGFVDLTVYRYDMPDETIVATFNNGMVLHRVIPYPDELRIDSLWSIQTETQDDYTLSLKLFDANTALVAQNDSHPLNGQRPTADWQLNEWVYDSRQINTESLLPGDYELVLQVYRWSEDGIEDVLTTEGEPWVVVEEVTR